MKNKQLIPLLLLLIMIVSCERTNTTNKEEHPFHKRENTTSTNMSMNYYGLPSPMEIAYAISTTGAEYDQELLHNPSMSSRYTTNRAMALNLGIYGADLCYSIYFDQQQVAMQYMGCVKSLASDLDISNILSDSTLRKIEDNIQNKEMLKKYVSETFFHSDAFLKESNRSETASIMMLGMWIESLYISTKLTKGDVKNNEALSQRIMEQGLVLDNIKGLLKKYSSSDIDSIRVGIETLRNNYLEAGYKSDDSLIVKITIPDYDKFNVICQTVDSLRNEYIDLF
ncbi:MAG: hypothetical protein MJ211_00070 [Bacteroidales bacterium]|nr:hypothetical protein [Bacteroidales bacterium]